jgi:hypothetical protein
VEQRNEEMNWRDYNSLVEFGIIAIQRISAALGAGYTWVFVHESAYDSVYHFLPKVSRKLLLDCFMPKCVDIR